MKSKMKRICNEMDELIIETARKNNISLTEASRKLARLVKQNGNKKIVEEIKF